MNAKTRDIVLPLNHLSFRKGLGYGNNPSQQPSKDNKKKTMKSAYKKEPMEIKAL